MTVMVIGEGINALDLKRVIRSKGHSVVQAHDAQAILDKELGADMVCIDPNVLFKMLTKDNGEGLRKKATSAIRVMRQCRERVHLAME